MASEEFTIFARRLELIAPEVGAAMAADGEERLPDMDMPVLWMSSVGHAIASVLPSLSTQARQEVFDLVEEGVAVGGDLLRTALATGLLEALVNDVDRLRVPRDLVMPILGPASRSYVDEWNRFTLGESS